MAACGAKESRRYNTKPKCVPPGSRAVNFRVELPSKVSAGDRVLLVGDFNGWSCDTYSIDLLPEGEEGFTWGRWVFLPLEKDNVEFRLARRSLTGEVYYAAGGVQSRKLSGWSSNETCVVINHSHEGWDDTAQPAKTPDLSAFMCGVAEKWSAALWAEVRKMVDEEFIKWKQENTAQPTLEHDVRKMVDEEFRKWKQENTAQPTLENDVLLTSKVRKMVDEELSKWKKESTAQATPEHDVILTSHRDSALSGQPGVAPDGSEGDMVERLRVDVSALHGAYGRLKNAVEAMRGDLSKTNVLVMKASSKARHADESADDVCNRINKLEQAFLNGQHSSHMAPQAKHAEVQKATPDGNLKARESHLCGTLDDHCASDVTGAPATAVEAQRPAAVPTATAAAPPAGSASLQQGSMVADGSRHGGSAPTGLAGPSPKAVGSAATPAGPAPSKYDTSVPGSTSAAEARAAQSQPRAPASASAAVAPKVASTPAARAQPAPVPKAAAAAVAGITSAPVQQNLRVGSAQVPWRN